jgi:adenylate kinase
VDETELKTRIAERQKISGRADDAAEKLVKRIDEYFTKTIKVLPYYEAQGKLQKVNGVGAIEDIFNNLTGVIDPLL